MPRRDGGTVRINLHTPAPADYETPPTPVFDCGTRQLSPDFVPPLCTMSNCPMRCGFCSTAAGSDSFLHAEHIAALGVERVDFVDQYLAMPRQLRIGRELSRIGHRATWQCHPTASDQLLQPDACQALAEAGCRAVQLGPDSSAELRPCPRKPEQCRNPGPFLHHRGRARRADQSDAETGRRLWQVSDQQTAVRFVFPTPVQTALLPHRRRWWGVRAPSVSGARTPSSGEAPAIGLSRPRPGVSS